MEDRFNTFKKAFCQTSGVWKYRNTSSQLALTNILLSRHETAAAVCRRDGGVIVAHAHHALRDSIPISQTYTPHVLECISIPLEPVSELQFSDQSGSVKSPPPRLCTSTAISWREYSNLPISRNYQSLH